MPDERVVIVGYDDRWPSEFEAEKAVIQRALGQRALDVMHIGSTAVPGLSSKPVIDIMVAVESLEESGPLDGLLAHAGYTRFHHDEDDKRLFYWKGAPRTHHVHVVRLNSWTYWRHLLFRDMMRQDQGLRDEYEQLKVRLADRLGDDRDAYTKAKGEFIEKTVAEAVRRGMNKESGPNRI